MMNINALDFSECHSEEVMFLLMLSVWSCNSYANPVIAT